MTNIVDEIERRRTFAIISHPDAGKTTLTEKLLLFGGAIQLAGAVKARGERRRARSDWMRVEQERGISVTASVMRFGYRNCEFNLLDTPGHEDFSEDTYRVLTAVDSAVMVIDAARGIEAQTRKLFEVCRLRDMPVTTFINKMDREGRDLFDLVDEIEQTLQIEVSPVNWPVGAGRDFQGCFDLPRDRLILAPRDRGESVQETTIVEGLDSPEVDAALPNHIVEPLREQVEMARELLTPFNLDAYRVGNLSPMFFGSALKNFGVAELLDGMVSFAPHPQPQPALPCAVEPVDEAVSGFVFKIQANTDPKHRDRIAFMRLASGHFRRGMKLRHHRTGKLLTIHNPLIFMAQERERAEEAFAGDIVGLPNHGLLHIGDALSEDREIRFTGIPSFAPEHLQRVRATDPMKTKHLSRALNQLAQEGAAHVFRPQSGADFVIGVMGPLQFDVLADRIRTEYDVPVAFEPAHIHTARWLASDENHAIRNFSNSNRSAMAEDHQGRPVFMARNAWHLDRAAVDAPEISFLAVREQDDVRLDA